MRNKKNKSKKLKRRIKEDRLYDDDIEKITPKNSKPKIKRLKNMENDKQQCELCDKVGDINDFHHASEEDCIWICSECNDKN